MRDWFSVDKKGLAQILERRGRAFAVLELISNGWDQNTTVVDVTLKETDRRAKYELVVTDDDPNGFADLTHAFTLFAPSEKKVDAEKRGRFNLGEKLVLALCDEATITSTTGGVHFDATGRKNIRTRRDIGSEFRAIIHLRKSDFQETCEIIRTLLPPAGVTTTFNGDVIDTRQPVHTFTAQLPTEIADEDGNLRPSARNTTISVYEPLVDEVATIYELGIPVVENGDRWHCNVGQKVPLNMDRDNVKPAYLRQLRTLVLNEMHGRISEEDANATWAKEAIEDPRVTEEAVRTVIEKRFGDKAVIFDPSDQEANRIATAQGFTVIAPRSMSRDAWSNVRRFELLQPAGKVTPSPTSLFNLQLGMREGGGEMEIPEEKWTDGQRLVLSYAERLGEQLLGFRPGVALISEITLHALAFYTPSTQTVTFNVGKLGHRWFDQPDQHLVDELLLHEFAHDRAGNHLDHAFHDELCRLGALLRDVDVRLDK